jgi:hypothetical protein
METADQDPEESEEEIWEEGIVPVSASKAKPSTKIQEPYDGESEDDDDVPIPSTSQTKPPVQNSQTKPVQSTSEDPYDGETDDDEVVVVPR